MLKTVLRPAGDDSVVNSKIIKLSDICENAFPSTKIQSIKQSNLEMQKRQKELNEIINKYSQK